ncbi:MAG: hypothetical protein WDM81_03410 [Rhizomicrobium sp.]
MFDKGPWHGERVGRPREPDLDQLPTSAPCRCNTPPVAILRLVETRKLALDNTAGQFVPGAPAVTVQALLAIPPEAPGAAAGYELLARVAAAATGKSFAAVEDTAALRLGLDERHRPRRRNPPRPRAASPRATSWSAAR